MLPVSKMSKELVKLLSEVKNKRVCVVGTSCIGKSTLVRLIDGARDQDEEVFPKMTEEELEYVCRSPVTGDISQVMDELVKRYADPIVPGKPFFGTVLLDCDLVILLDLNNEELARRCSLRGGSLHDVKVIQAAVEHEVFTSPIPNILCELN